MLEEERGGKKNVTAIKMSQSSAACPSDTNSNKTNTLEMWEAVVWRYMLSNSYLLVYFTKIWASPNFQKMY